MENAIETAYKVKKAERILATGRRAPLQRAVAGRDRTATQSFLADTDGRLGPPAGPK